MNVVVGCCCCDVGVLRGVVGGEVFGGEMREERVVCCIAL